MDLNQGTGTTIIKYDAGFHAPVGKGIRTFPCTLEEEPNNKHLQTSHGHHHQAFNHTKVEDPPLGAANRAKIAILAGPEVFLVASNSRQLSRQFVDGLFKSRCLLGTGTLS